MGHRGAGAGGASRWLTPCGGGGGRRVKHFAMAHAFAHRLQGASGLVAGREGRGRLDLALVLDDQRVREVHRRGAR